MSCLYIKFRDEPFVNLNVPYVYPLFWLFGQFYCFVSGFGCSALFRRYEERHGEVILARGTLTRDDAVKNGGRHRDLLL